MPYSFSFTLLFHFMPCYSSLLYTQCHTLFQLTYCHYFKSFKACPQWKIEFTCRTEILKFHAEDIARHGLMQLSYTQVFIDFTNYFIFSWRFLGILQHHIVQLC